MKKLSTLLFSLAIHLAIFGQTALTGNISDAETSEPLQFATIAIFQNGSLKTGSETGLDGSFFIGEIEPGDYEVEVSYTGFQVRKFERLSIAEGKPTILEVDLKAGLMLPTIEIVYPRPLMEQSGCILWGYVCHEQEVVEAKKENEPENIVEPSVPTVFPNPTSGHLNVAFPDSCEEMLVTDVSGKILQRHTQLEEGTAALDLSNLSAGTYFLKGEEFTLKVVVAY